MPLSETDTTTYTKIFKESPNLTGETMPMDNVVQLCRTLGWPEDQFPTTTIQAWTTKEGPLNCEEFLKMFQTLPKQDVRKAKFRRYFVSMDTDGDGKVNVEELTKLYMEDDDVAEDVARKVAEDVMKFADKDGNKHMNFEEFLKTM